MEPATRSGYNLIRLCLVGWEAYISIIDEHNFK